MHRENASLAVQTDQQNCFEISSESITLCLVAEYHNFIFASIWSLGAQGHIRKVSSGSLNLVAPYRAILQYYRTIFVITRRGLLEKRSFRKSPSS